MESLQIDPTSNECAVIEEIKAGLKAHIETLEFKVCGVRIIRNRAELNFYDQYVEAMQTIDFKEFPYFIYNFPLHGEAPG